MNPAVVISARGEQRIAAGHPWIYRADLADVRGEGGDIVLVRDPRGRLLGHAMYSSASQIALRMLTYGEKPADEALIRRRIESAIAFRESLAIDSTAYRLVQRGRPAPVADRRSVWRVSRRADAVSGDGSPPPAVVVVLNVSCVRVGFSRATTLAQNP